MSDVVLIAPRYEMKSIMTARGEKEQKTEKPVLNLQLYPPLGVSYLAACLEKNNISARIIDVSADSLSQEEIITILKKEKPMLTGIYVNSFSLHYSSLLIKKIRKDVKTRIIVGGNHITHEPSSVLYLGADYGFRGEAEDALPLIAKSIKEKKEPDDICGLIRIKDGKISSNGVARIDCLDKLPFPARNLLPADRYYTPFSKGRITTMMTSRGCYFNCIFCSSHTKKIANRSPMSIVGELKHLDEEGFDFILIEDDLFTFDKERAKKICSLMIKNGIKLRWACSTRADLIDLDMLMLMKKAGCSLIGFGIESGDGGIRNKVIGKNVSNEEIIAAFENARKAGIRTLAYCMFGHPGETLDDMNTTLKFVLKLNPDYVDFSLATIIPCSRLFDIALKEGKIDENIWEDMAKSNKPIPIYVPEGLTLDDLKRMQKKAFLRFYLRPGKILQEIASVRDIGDVSFKIRNMLKMLGYFNGS